MILIILVSILTNKSVNTIHDLTDVNVRTCVVIDAGHGGIDGGAVSCTGVSESEINLNIALRLNDLMHLLGIETKMIRETDMSVHTKGETIAAKKVSDLKNRVSITNRTSKAILISIHQNYFPDQKYAGAQVFYADPTISKILGISMQNALVTALNPASNRKAKQTDNIYLLKNIINPGILIECGFLSNPQEEAKLRDPQYQKLLCAAIGSEISRYISNTYAA